MADVSVLYLNDVTYERQEIPSHGFMPPPNSQVAVYIHVCPYSYKIHSEDFEVTQYIYLGVFLVCVHMFGQ